MINFMQHLYLNKVQQMPNYYLNLFCNSGSIFHLWFDIRRIHLLKNSGGILIKISLDLKAAKLF